MNLFGSDKVQHVWVFGIALGMNADIKTVVSTVKSGDGSLIVWGSMSSQDVVELQFLKRAYLLLNHYYFVKLLTCICCVEKFDNL